MYFSYFLSSIAAVHPRKNHQQKCQSWPLSFLLDFDLLPFSVVFYLIFTRFEKGKVDRLSRLILSSACCETKRLDQRILKESKR